MELIIRVRDDKAAYVAELVKKMEFVEDVEVKYNTTTKSFDPLFLNQIRASVADSENPEEAYKNILVALEEVRLIDEGKMKPQSARQMLDELKKELADENP